MRLSSISDAIRTVLTGERFRNRWRIDILRRVRQRHQTHPTEASKFPSGDEAQPPAGPELPPEVWENCWQDGLLSLSDLKSLSATSRYLRDICEPDIYRVINITLEDLLAAHSRNPALRMRSPPITPDTILRRMNQMVEKLQKLAESERHRLLVKEFHFQTVPNIVHFLLFRFQTDKALEISRMHHLQVKQLFDYLPSFHNIRTLSLSLIDIDARALSAISKLSSLNSLRVNEAFFVCNKFTPRLALESLDLSPGTKHDEAFDFPDIFSAARLRDLKFQAICFKEGNNILQVMGAQGPRAFSYLSSLDLSLEIGSLPFLETFLSENAVTLKTLKIEFYLALPVIFPFSLQTTQENRSFNVPLTAMPSLRSFSGPLFVAKSVLPGRPVQSIEIKSYLSDDEIRTWQDLVEHIVPICQEVPCDILDLNLCFNLDLQHGLFEMITRYFPALRSLNLTLASEMGRTPIDDFPNHVLAPQDGLPVSDPLTFLVRGNPNSAHVFLIGTNYILVCLDIL